MQANYYNFRLDKNLAMSLWHKKLKPQYLHGDGRKKFKLTKPPKAWPKLTWPAHVLPLLCVQPTKNAPPY